MKEDTNLSEVGKDFMKLECYMYHPKLSQAFECNEYVMPWLTVWHVLTLCINVALN